MAPRSVSHNINWFNCLYDKYVIIHNVHKSNKAKLEQEIYVFEKYKIQSILIPKITTFFVLFLLSTKINIKLVQIYA